ncbi:MAG: hypothetical protein ISS63_12685 [Desulfobacteraceae bacterium]|nr:hypothetical protein [Desulfobacteraceae bacterium]
MPGKDEGALRRHHWTGANTTQRKGVKRCNILDVCRSDDAPPEIMLGLVCESLIGLAKDQSIYQVLFSRV